MTTLPKLDYRNNHRAMLVVGGSSSPGIRSTTYLRDRACGHRQAANQKLRMNRRYASRTLVDTIFSLAFRVIELDATSHARMYRKSDRVRIRDAILRLRQFGQVAARSLYVTALAVANCLFQPRTD